MEPCLLGSKRMATKSDNQGSKETPAEQRAHVHAILEKMTYVMFGSYRKTGPAPQLNTRPLAVTKLDEDDTLWFMVAADSDKVQEIQRYAGCQLTAQSDTRWIHLWGSATVVNDRAKIKELWGKHHEVWFPDGPDDPNVCLVRFVPDGAEYWDNSGVIGIKYLFNAMKGLITGKGADEVKGLHGQTGPKH
jgi:general stress protein 26